MNQFINKKKDVFCDTMIWYYVSDNKVVLDHENFNYYGNTINISDFITSDKHKNINQIGGLKKAIRTMHDNSKDVVMIDPFSIAAYNLLNIEIPKEEKFQYNDAYNKLVEFSLGEVIKIISPGVSKLIKIKTEFQKGVFAFKRELNRKFNDKLFKKELRSKNNGLNDNELKNQVVEVTVAEWLLENINLIYHVNYKYEDVVDWSPTILFIKTFSQFILDIQQNLPDPNSMLDYLHLLFIKLQGNTLLWTTETSLLSKIYKKFDPNICKTIVYQDYLGKNYSFQNKI